MSSTRTTTSSPWTLGMTDTRKSTVRCPRSPSGTAARKRPSWGTRRSATSSSAMTLMRATMVWWWIASTGAIAG